jgi:hypothetical protein
VPTVGTITQPTCTVATGSVVLNGLPSSDKDSRQCDNNGHRYINNY